MKTYLSDDSWYLIDVLPDHLIPSPDQFEQMWNQHPEERGKVIIYGQEKTIPRYQQSYLQSYKFSGVESKAKDLPAIFQPYLDWCNLTYNLTHNLTPPDLSPRYSYNQVLLNWYHPEHYIGTHWDDESQLVPNSPIATISFGQSRKFRIRDREKKIVKDIQTGHGTVLIMGGKFQKEFKHEIVKVTGKKLESMDRRISFTARIFK